MLTDKLKLFEKQDEAKREANEIEPVVRAIEAKMITVVLCEGGNFSIGVFDHEKEVTHRSDHKYVIRKKQGKRQSTKDKGKSISSMGSQIRRANEVKHQENIEDIIDDVKEHIIASDLVLIQAPGDNASLLFDEGRSLFQFKKKSNFKSLCLVAKKANYSEIKKIRDHILKVYIISEDKLLPG